MVREILNDMTKYGTKFERVHVDDDSYEGIIVDVSDVFKTTGYDGDEVEKIRMDIDIEIEDGEIVRLPYFMTAIISDAGEKSTKYRNSTLYDVISESGRLDSYMAMRMVIFKDELSYDERNKIFADFLRKIFCKSKVKVFTKTVKPASGEQYSTVSEIIKFISVPDLDAKKKKD